MRKLDELKDLVEKEYRNCPKRGTIKKFNKGESYSTAMLSQCNDVSRHLNKAVEIASESNVLTDADYVHLEEGTRLCGNGVYGGRCGDACKEIRELLTHLKKYE